MHCKETAEVKCEITDLFTAPNAVCLPNGIILVYIIRRIAKIGWCMKLAYIEIPLKYHIGCSHTQRVIVIPENTNHFCKGFFFRYWRVWCKATFANWFGEENNISKPDNLEHFNDARRENYLIFSTWIKNDSEIKTDKISWYYNIRSKTKVL